MKNKQGFTLVEILVILAIIGVLAGIAFVSYDKYVVQAKVAEALEFADAGRLQVDEGLATGSPLLKTTDLLRSNKADMMTALTWVPASASNGKPGGEGYILAEMQLSVQAGKQNVLALKRLADGTWWCVSAEQVGAPNPLKEKYLPAGCHGSGSPLPSAKSAPSCPPDQEMVALPTGPACTAKCQTGQQRDKTNPAQCKDVICGPNEYKNGKGDCINVGAQPDCGATGDPHVAYSVDNTPSWMCFPKCSPGSMRDPNNWFSCIADPNAKVSAPAVVTAPPANNAASAAAKSAAAPKQPPPVSQPSTQCHVCNPDVPDLCELVSVEATCTYPNNWCVTTVNNHQDGTKDVVRRCGNFEQDARLEWYQGTSDDDKCRERIDRDQSLDFKCTFACNAPNCNQPGGSLRPPEDSLYQPR